MQNHPIPSVTDPLQYRAIGLVRGIYKPQDDDTFTRGALIDSKGNEIARGLVNYDSEEVNKIRGEASEKILDLLGYSGDEEIIHRDNLVLV